MVLTILISYLIPWKRVYDGEDDDEEEEEGRGRKKGGRNEDEEVRVIVNIINSNTFHLWTKLTL